LQFETIRNTMQKEGKSMPYHQNKQDAFQAAEKGTMEAKEWYDHLVRDQADYGSQLKHLK